jgi:hypothetical protein
MRLPQPLPLPQVVVPRPQPPPLLPPIMRLQPQSLQPQRPAKVPQPLQQLPMTQPQQQLQLSLATIAPQLPRQPQPLITLPPLPLLPREEAEANPTRVNRARNPRRNPRA